jgi:hypothetical protein
MNLHDLDNNVSKCFVGLPNVDVVGAEGVVVGGSHASHVVVDVELVQGSWRRGEVVWTVVDVEEDVAQKVAIHGRQCCSQYEHVGENKLTISEGIRREVRSIVVEADVDIHDVE